MDFALNAPEPATFGSPILQTELSGPLQMAASDRMETGNRQRPDIDLRIESENARSWFSGKLSAQCSISNNVIYVNDFSASLNDTDFVNATGTLNLRPPHRYNGKVSASVSNLSTLRAAVSRFWQSEPTGRLIQIGLGGKRRRADV